MNGRVEQEWGYKPGKKYAEYGNAKRYQEPMVKDPAYLIRPVFARPARDQRLQAIIQSKADACKNEVIHACNACSCQCFPAQMPKENIIYDEVQLWYKQGQTYRKGYFQDLFV